MLAAPHERPRRGGPQVPRDLRRTVRGPVPGRSTRGARGGVRVGRGVLEGRGIGNQETAASAANLGYTNAMATLLMLSKAELDLDDALVRSDASALGGGFVLRGECPHFNQPIEDSPDYDSYWTSD